MQAHNPDKHVEESTQSDKITHLEKTAAMAAACADERAAQLTTALWQCQVDCHKFQDELSEARADLDLSREDVSHMRSALDNARSELRQAENQAALHHSTAVDIERMRAELSELKALTLRQNSRLKFSIILIATLALLAATSFIGIATDMFTKAPTPEGCRVFTDAILLDKASIEAQHRDILAAEKTDCARFVNETVATEKTKVLRQLTQALADEAEASSARLQTSIHKCKTECDERVLHEITRQKNSCLISASETAAIARAAEAQRITEAIEVERQAGQKRVEEAIAELSVQLDSRIAKAIEIKATQLNMQHLEAISHEKSACILRVSEVVKAERAACDTCNAQIGRNDSMIPEFIAVNAGGTQEQNNEVRVCKSATLPGQHAYCKVARALQGVQVLSKSVGIQTATHQVTLTPSVFGAVLNPEQEAHDATNAQSYYRITLWFGVLFVVCGYLSMQVTEEVTRDVVAHAKSWTTIALWICTLVDWLSYGHLENHGCTVYTVALVSFGFLASAILGLVCLAVMQDCGNSAVSLVLYLILSYVERIVHANGSMVVDHQICEVIGHVVNCTSVAILFATAEMHVRSSGSLLRSTLLSLVSAVVKKKGAGLAHTAQWLQATCAILACLSAGYIIAVVFADVPHASSACGCVFLIALWAKGHRIERQQ